MANWHPQEVANWHPRAMANRHPWAMANRHPRVMRNRAGVVRLPREAVSGADPRKVTATVEPLAFAKLPSAAYAVAAEVSMAGCPLTVETGAAGILPLVVEAEAAGSLLPSL
ncbi:UNVERIFIED_CONTAM: hypothetical protein FKN15_024842 [Acipenser sinensis]